MDLKTIGFYKPVLKQNNYNNINTFLIIIFGTLITSLLIYIIIPEIDV